MKLWLFMAMLGVIGSQPDKAAAHLPYNFNHLTHCFTWLGCQKAVRSQTLCPAELRAQIFNYEKAKESNEVNVRLSRLLRQWHILSVNLSIRQNLQKKIVTS
jgi:hypothetical protein